MITKGGSSFRKWSPEKTKKKMNKKQSRRVLPIHHTSKVHQLSTEGIIHVCITSVDNSLPS